MKDLIFVIKNDGTYEQVPNKNLRAQENYSDNFVVIANQVGVVKAKIRLLSRTDKVEVKYLVPSLENVEDLIGDKVYFQEYANANVWRGAVPKKLLQEISMSYAGQIEISFSFTKPVLDKRAITKLGDLYGDLPQTADEGDYYIIKLSTYTKNDVTWYYGQQAIYINGGWIKGGTYKVIGTSTTYRLNVEPTLLGEQAEFDTENEDEYLLALQYHNDLLDGLQNETDDHELRISTNEQDIDDIESGATVVGKAESDEAGRVIEDTYITDFTITPSQAVSAISITYQMLNGKGGTAKHTDFDLVAATQSFAGVMTAADKTKLDNLWAVLQDSDNPNFVDTINEILAIFANYPEGLDILSKFAEKVDKTTKVNSKALSGDITLSAKDILINTGGGALDGETTESVLLKHEAEKADANNKAAILGVLTPNDIINGSTEPKLVTGKEMRDFGVELVTEYGVRAYKNQASPTLIRLKRVNGELFIGAATNLVANVGVNDQIVLNSFDNINIFQTELVWVDGNLMVKRRLYFHKLEYGNDSGGDYTDSFVCEYQLGGYIRPRIFIDDAGEEIDFAYLSAYEASEDETGKARSMQNVHPKINITRGNARKAARKNDGDGNNTDSEWGIMDMAEYQYHIIVPFEIEFATRHSQSVMVGATGLSYSDEHAALTTESDDNIVVLTNAQAASYVVGQTIAIGASLGSSSVALNRLVTDVQLDTPIAGQATITFDGAAVTVTAGNIVSTRAWRTGMTNGIKASSGAFTANSNKYPIVFRGYENPYGNIFKFVDGGKITDYQLFVTDIRSAYDDVASVGGTFAAPFVPLAYMNAGTSDYVKELGFDKMFPYARLPKVVGGAGTGASAYYADYYYRNTGDRLLAVGGSWAVGGWAGMFTWDCARSIADGNLNFGFRLSYRPLKKGVS